MKDQPPDPSLDKLVTELSSRVPGPDREKGRSAMRLGKRLRRKAAIKRVAGPVAGLLAVAGVMVLLGTAFGLFGPSRPAASPGCGPGSAGQIGALGAVAYVRDDSLHVLELGGHHDRVVAAHGVGRPVRWSPDGRWIAFEAQTGTVGVVQAAGGPICEPLGSGIQSWSWAPGRPVLAGVTEGGGLVVGGPAQRLDVLLPEASNVRGMPYFDGSGRWVAVGGGPSADRGVAASALWKVEVQTRQATEVLLLPKGDQSQPIVAGWSPDGSWILLWGQPSGPQSVGTGGVPLEAVRASGGQPVQIVPDMPARPDLLDWCGSRLVVVAGGGSEATFQKRLVLSEPPAWSLTALSPKLPATDSELWPSCSPHGQLVVASVGPSHHIATGPLDSRWVLWLVQPTGFIGGPNTDPSPGFSDEASRWSRDGSSILFVRRTVGTSHGALFLLKPRSPAIGPGDVTGPLADLGSYPDTFGYFPWFEGIDWFQPRR